MSGPRYVVQPVHATEERGVKDVPWRLSLDVPDGWRLLQVFSQSGPAADGSVVCVLERVDLCKQEASVSRRTR